MAKGKEQHQQRQAAVSLLGRDLARRAKSRCELCRAQTSLSATELAPLPEEPELDSALLLCSSCVPLAQMPPKVICTPVETSLQRFSFLNEAVWSEVAPVQIAAVRSLRILGKSGASWARDLEDSLYLPPETAARLEQ